MKTGLILTFEFPPSPGGIGTHAFQLAHHFHRLGIPVSVLTTGSGTTAAACSALDQALPFEVRRFRDAKLFPLKVSGRLLRTLRHCRNRDVGWIYVCTSRSVYLAWACSRLLGIPYFVAGYGTEYGQRFPGRRRLLDDAAGRIAISAYSAEMMRTHTSRPVDVVHLGADTEYFDPALVTPADTTALRDEHGIAGGPLLLSVGSLKPRKGHDITLRALVQLRRRYPFVQLVIVGSDSEPGAAAYRDELYRYIEQHGLADNVRVLPNLPAAALRTLYSMVDVLVMSSREADGDVEGFGIVLLEANAMGLPVVAADSGGMVDAVADGVSGLLFRSEDSADLACRLEGLLADLALRQKLGSGGRLRALEEYNWETVAHRTLALINSKLSAD